MSIAGLLFRFTWIYVGLSVAIFVAISALGLNFSHGNTVALICATLGAVSGFGYRNRRALERGEFWKAALGMWGIETALQLLLAFVSLTAAGLTLSAGMLMTIVLFIGLIHGSSILGTAWLTNWMNATNFKNATNFNNEKNLKKEVRSVFE